MNPEPTDPNPERDDVPFPTQSGPPRYPVKAGKKGKQQPQVGNGHAAGYEQPAEQPMPSPNLPPPAYPQAAYPQAAYPQAADPYGQRPPVQQPAASNIGERLAMLETALQVGAMQVASVWGQHIALFQNEYHKRTGQLITEREAFELITTPLLVVLDD